LQDKIPDYMIPSFFIALEAMPLTDTLKIDRKALPRPNGLRPEIAAPFAAPRNPIEQTLAMIWAEVLELDRVGVDDNFIDLGGHSLTATRIVSRVVDRFRLDMTVKVLFDSPTVAEMAAVVGAQNGPELGKILCEIEALPDEAVEINFGLDHSARSKI
jgi:acyl carrier protein